MSRLRLPKDADLQDIHVRVLPEDFDYLASIGRELSPHTTELPSWGVILREALRRLKMFHGE